MDILQHVQANQWKNLNRKEKEFVRMFFSRKYTQKQIMDRLYINSSRTFRAIRQRVTNKIKS